MTLGKPESPNLLFAKLYPNLLFALLSGKHFSCAESPVGKPERFID